MKILSSILIALWLMASGLFAQGAPAALTSGTAEWSVHLSVSNSVKYDSLVGAADSITIFANQAFASGYEYVLSRDAITGCSTDSIKIALRITNHDISSATNYQTVYVDSFTRGPGEQILLPIGRTLVGNKFTLKAMAYTGGADKVYLNRLTVWKRRAKTI